LRINELREAFFVGCDGGECGATPAGVFRHEYSWLGVGGVGGVNKCPHSWLHNSPLL